MARGNKGRGARGSCGTGRKRDGSGRGTGNIKRK